MNQEEKTGSLHQINHMSALCTSEEVVGALRSVIANSSRGPRHMVEAYVNLISSDPLLHIRIRELRERAFSTHRRRPRRAPSLAEPRAEEEESGPPPAEEEESERSPPRRRSRRHGRRADAEAEEGDP